MGHRTYRLPWRSSVDSPERVVLCVQQSHEVSFICLLGVAGLVDM